METKILRADKILYQGKTEKIIVPGFFGEMTILPDHMPLITYLKKGIIEVFSSRNQKRSFRIAKGIINIRDNKISILVDQRAEEIKVKTK